MSMVDLTVSELAEHFARLLHVRAGHLTDWPRCADLQCSERREALARVRPVAGDQAELRELVKALRVAVGACKFCLGRGEQGDPNVATWECPWCAPARALLGRYPGAEAAMGEGR